MTAFVALAVLLSPTLTSAQLLRGGPIGGRLERFKDRMTSKDESIRYDPSVLATGVSRGDVVAKMGEPNASQGEGVAREDVWVFFPDGSKFKDPEITGLLPPRFLPPVCRSQCARRGPPWPSNNSHCTASATTIKIVSERCRWYHQRTAQNQPARPARRLHQPPSRYASAAQSSS